MQLLRHPYDVELASDAGSNVPSGMFNDHPISNNVPKGCGMIQIELFLTGSFASWAYLFIVSNTWVMVAGSPSYK